MIKLADYVINFLVKKRIKDIFLVSGGGIMYLTDSVCKNKNIRYVANHHEQASATAAESYARVKNHFGACLVTTGPGGTNAITGVAGAWVDSIPIFVISGQVKRELISDYKILRQKGPQEINIIDMVKPITKYAITVANPDNIRYELEKSYNIMQEDRPGPIWLNIPLDVQGAMIDEKKLNGYQPPDKSTDRTLHRKQVSNAIKLLKSSKRPVLILGNGVRLSRGEKLSDIFINKIKIPVLLPLNGLDLVADDNPYLMGKFGPFGQRRGNFTLQNSDLILSIGASLNVAAIGFDISGFAPNAKKIMVNIDKGELIKDTLRIDFGIEMDAKEFMEEFLEQTERIKFSTPSKWHTICQYWKEKYPNLSSDYTSDKNYVNSYIFFDRLSDLTTSRDIITTGIGLEVYGLYQVYKIKKGQRAFVNKNFGQMGWCLPAAIGANVGNGRKRTICVTGDGSILMNIQELETIKYYRLPIKIFVFNNRGYESIRFTQNNLFEGRFIGSDESSGVSNPDFKHLAAAHNLGYEYIKNDSQLRAKIKKVLKQDGPVLCEVNISYSQRRMPRVITVKKRDGTLISKPLEDMWPFLPEKEIYDNMHLSDL